MSDAGLIEGLTVLVVDDEELMREVVTIMVEENGGKALAAADGQEAVELFQEKSKEIDVVVMDFSMPRLNGYEAFVQMRAAREDVKVVLASGLAITQEVLDLKERQEIEFLAKPFPEIELMKAIRKITGR